MQDRIPIPTDNIFKFYALFGLLLMIFSWSAGIYVGRQTNELAFSTLVELETLKALPTPTVAERTKRDVLQRQLDIAVEDRNFFKWASAVVGALACCLLVYGFSKWHKEIQPVQDETAKLQLEKLRLEVAELRRAESEKVAPPAPPR